MIYIIEGSGELVNEKGEETPLNAGDFALVNPKGSRQKSRRETPVPQRRRPTL